MFSSQPRLLLSTGYLLAHVVVERSPHQRCGQPSVRPRGKSTEGFWVGGQPECLSGPSGALVEVRPHPCPDVLDFTQKDICSSVANSLEILQHPLGSGYVLATASRNFTQITGVFVDHPLRHLGESRRRTIVVADIVRPAVSVDHGAAIG